MLHNEHRIIHKRNVPQRELDRVPRDATPVALDPAIDALLCDAQHPAEKVQQDLPDAPALCALVAPVRDHLGRILDERDEKLDVADRVDDVESAPVCGGVDGASGGSGCDEEVGREDAEEAAGSDAEDEARRADARVGGETPEGSGEILRGGDDREEQGVESESDVVEGDGGGQAGVTGGVLFANDGGVVEGGVGDEVCGETWYYCVSPCTNMLRDSKLSYQRC